MQILLKKNEFVRLSHSNFNTLKASICSPTKDGNFQETTICEGNWIEVLNSVLNLLGDFENIDIKNKKLNAGARFTFTGLLPSQWMNKIANNIPKSFLIKQAAPKIKNGKLSASAVFVQEAETQKYQRKENAQFMTSNMFRDYLLKQSEFPMFIENLEKK